MKWLFLVIMMFGLFKTVATQAAEPIHLSESSSFSAGDVAFRYINIDSVFVRIFSVLHKSFLSQKILYHCSIRNECFSLSKELYLELSSLQSKRRGILLSLTIIGNNLVSIASHTQGRRRVFGFASAASATDL